MLLSRTEDLLLVGDVADGAGATLVVSLPLAMLEPTIGVDGRQLCARQSSATPSGRTSEIDESGLQLVCWLALDSPTAQVCVARSVAVSGLLLSAAWG